MAVQDHAPSRRPLIVSQFPRPPIACCRALLAQFLQWTLCPVVAAPHPPFANVGTQERLDRRSGAPMLGGITRPTMEVSTMFRNLPVLAVAGVVSLALASPADAASSRKRVKAGYGYVTTYGYSLPVRVSGAVRNGRSGKEVQLPGGSWVNCFGGCAYALRRNTVDFWEWQDSRGRRSR